MSERKQSQDSVAEPKRCHPECPGWLHMEDPREVQACSECSRFTIWDPAAITEHDGSNPRGAYVSRDDLAQQAHAQECGCAWGQESKGVLHADDEWAIREILPLSQQTQEDLKLALTATTFIPTHEITVYAGDMRTVSGTVLVQLVTWDGAGGPAYTIAEWEERATASWARERDGSWLFKGQPINCSVREL